MRFPLGQTVMTIGISERSKNDPCFQKFMQKSLARHAQGDWGEIPEEDRRENELSLQEGYRLLSAYALEGEKIWIITEADRSATTILFPDEY